MANPMPGKIAFILISLTIGAITLADIRSFGQTPVPGGGWSGNGGDLNKGSDNPWFLGSEPVSYCILSTEDFPVNRTVLSDLVRDSFNLWKTFFQKYQMTQLSWPPMVQPDEHKSITFPDRKQRKLSLNFTESHCDTPDTSVTLPENHLYFLFGVNTPLTDTWRQMNEESSLGMALRQSYNHHSYRNSGIVWVSPFSSDIKRMFHLILHETGHIFGMPHDSVFVMSQDIAYMLTNTDRLSSDFFGMIESTFWPYKLRPGDKAVLSSRRGFKDHKSNAFSRPGERRPPPQACTDHDYSPNISMPTEFRKHLKLDETGCHKITLIKNSDGIAPVPDQKSYYTLLTTSDTGKEFKISAVFSSHFPSIKGARSFKGPSLFTQWSVGANGEYSKWIPVPLDSKVNWWHSSGYLQLNRKITLAAKLNFEAGPFLEIYLPISKTWWTLKSLPEFKP